LCDASASDSIIGEKLINFVLDHAKQNQLLLEMVCYFCSGFPPFGNAYFKIL